MNTSPWLTLLWVLHPHCFSEHPLSFPPILQSYTSLDKAHLGSMYRCRYKVYIIWMRSSTIHRSFYRCLHPSSIDWSRTIKTFLLLSSQLIVNHKEALMAMLAAVEVDWLILLLCLVVIAEGTSSCVSSYIALRQHEITLQQALPESIFDPQVSPRYIYVAPLQPQCCLSGSTYRRTYVEDKFQLSSGHLHLCLNLHSVKHTSTAADKPIRPAVQYNHNFIWGRSIRTLVLSQHGSVREETVYSIC